MLAEYDPTLAPHGVGAVLSVNARTRAFDKFFGGLSSSYGNPIDVSRAHITLVDSAETAIHISTERDLIALQHTSEKFLEYLGMIPINDMVLRPDPEIQRLEKFGRHLGIVVAKTPELTAIRKHMAELSVTELGVSLEREYVPHLSVTRKQSGRNKTRKRVPPFPKGIPVNGYSVDIRSFEQDPRRARSKQEFINQPRSRQH